MKQLKLAMFLFLGTSFAVCAGDTILNLKLDTLKSEAVLKGKADKSKLFEAGTVGKAMRFNNGKYQLVVAPDKKLDLINNFTIKCVFNAAKIDYFRTLLWKGDRKAKPQQINYYVSIHDGKMEFKFKNAKGSWKVFHTVKPVIKPGKWYTTVITFKDGIVTIYVNSKKYPLNQQKIMVKKLIKNKAPLYIGAGSNGSSLAYSFDGLIEQVTISKGIHPPTSKKE